MAQRAMVRRADDPAELARSRELDQHGSSQARASLGPLECRARASSRRCEGRSQRSALARG
jgi:hypothetical protein